MVEMSWLRSTHIAGKYK